MVLPESSSFASLDRNLLVSLVEKGMQVGFAELRPLDGNQIEIVWFQAIPSCGYGIALLQKIREHFSGLRLEVTPMPDPLVSSMSSEDYMKFFVRNGFRFTPRAGSMYWEPGMPKD